MGMVIFLQQIQTRNFMIANKKTIEGIEFHFGLGFLAELCDSLNLELHEIGIKVQTNPLLFVPKIMLTSANYAKKRNGLSDFYDLDFFYDKTDELGGATCELWADFLNSMTESMTKHVPKQDQTTDKKKVKK